MGVHALVKRWNDTVQRGNRRVQTSHLHLDWLDLDRWIAERLSDNRFAAFLAWLEPWQHAGYGLYRDNE
jgi:hypothetical protein